MIRTLEDVLAAIQGSDVDSGDEGDYEFSSNGESDDANIGRGTAALGPHRCQDMPLGGASD